MSDIADRTDQDDLFQFGEIIYQFRNGINQILLVIKGRFTEEKIESYNMLTIIFDKEIAKYTTIARSNFLAESCKNDAKKLQKENLKIACMLDSLSNNIIYVNNLPMNYHEFAKETRRFSRERLLDHLSTLRQVSSI